ncbi:hypothetical protein MJD09_15660, partial [bacterium]|nr:hypothetical protein [bacterium]
MKRSINERSQRHKKTNMHTLVQIEKNSCFWTELFILLQVVKRSHTIDCDKHMPYYPIIDPQTGRQKRKAGKLVWIITIYVEGQARYQKRHYGTKTEIARQEVKKHEELLEKAGVFPNSKKRNPTFKEFGEWWIEHLVIPNQRN